MAADEADREIAALAARQHGVVATRQLEAAGLSRSGIRRRVRSGRYHPIHRGVYAVGHTRLTHAGRCAAAVLACSPGAAVSHLSAAVLWRMLSFNAGLIEVTISTGNGRRKRRGIEVHRSHLSLADVTRRDGIPVTAPLRTLRDLKRTHPDLHQPAQRRALDLKLVKDEDLGPDPDLTRSELERLFLSHCRRRRIPAPEVNAKLEGFEVDFLWRAEKVIVEADGFEFHRDREAFERDRAKDAQLGAEGYRVIRVTHRRLRGDPSTVFDSLDAILGG